MQKESFKKQYSKEQRLKESENILKHYQDRVPIIIEKDKNSRLPDLDVQKYLFLSNFRVFQLNTLIRSKLNLNKAEAVYLFVNSKVALRGAQRRFMTSIRMMTNSSTYNIVNTIHLGFELRIYIYGIYIELQFLKQFSIIEYGFRNNLYGQIRNTGSELVENIYTQPFWF